ACSWISIDGTKKAVIVYQVGHFYFGDLGQYYFGANNCASRCPIASASNNSAVPAIRATGILSD
ncbi:MAG: hypothetical protein ACR2GP_01675, partial [Burkholderiaceae bacterium]